MSFASPWLLTALVIVPAVVAFGIAIDRRRSRYPVAFSNLHVLAGIVEERRSWRRWTPLALIALALACAAAAMARPTAPLTFAEENATVVFLVDVSGSMASADVEPTRLDAAVNAMREFLEAVPPRYKIGLVAFSSEPEVLVAPTRDRQMVSEALGYLTPESATALGDGLAAAVKLTVSSLAAEGIHHTPGQRLPAAIVLESDGAQNRGVLEPQQAARVAKAAGIRVYGVALGTPSGTVSFGLGDYKNTISVPPDPSTMQMIASVTGGKAYTAETAARVTNVYKTLGSSIGRQRRRREITSWFAAGAAALLLAALGAGRLVEGALP